MQYPAINLIIGHYLYILVIGPWIKRRPDNEIGPVYKPNNLQYIRTDCAHRLETPIGSGAWLGGRADRRSRWYIVRVGGGEF